MTGRRLSLADIVDQRAYDRERDDFRARIIDLKKRRRIQVGPFVTLVFENRDTIRFQIQEMARAEKLLTDDAIQIELDTYNPLIPEPGQLSATMFLELTTDEQLRTWLPRLVGIERHVLLALGADGDEIEVRCEVDADHERQLTRDEVTASVHYVHFVLDAAAVSAFRAGPVRLTADHPAYAHSCELAPATVTELLDDLGD